jgi:hypothetical protein
VTFRHRAGVSPYTSSFDLAETCVFGKQSLGPLHCGLLGHIARKSFTLPRRPFSRSYGTILPSSLTRVLSITLVFSTRPPVSVLVRARATSLEAFLGGMASGTRGLAATEAGLRVARRISLSSLLYAPCRHQLLLPLAYPVPPSVERWLRGAGI